MLNFWDFSVWGGFCLLGVLLLSLLVANALKKSIKFLEDSLIPTSVLGGGILLVIAGVYKLITGDVMFDTAVFGGNGTANLEVITYHALALGFIASTFKTTEGKLTQKRTIEIFNTGVTTVSTYLLQAIVGFAITLVTSSVSFKFFSILFTSISVVSSCQSITSKSNSSILISGIPPLLLSLLHQTPYCLIISLLTTSFNIIPKVGYCFYESSICLKVIFFRIIMDKNK